MMCFLFGSSSALSLAVLMLMLMKQYKSESYISRQIHGIKSMIIDNLKFGCTIIHMLGSIKFCQRGPNLPKFFFKVFFIIIS